MSEHNCPGAEKERFVSLDKTKEKGWVLWIHCNDDMDDIRINIKHCPFCGKTLIK